MELKYECFQREMNGGHVSTFLEKRVRYSAFDYTEMCPKCMHLKYTLDICGLIKKRPGAPEIIF